MKACPGCGAELPEVEGPTDPYGGASSSCWAAFGEVCARDFGEYAYPEVHRLIVDSYMAQHPGLGTPAGRRSLATHLVGLCCAIEQQMSSKDIGRVLGALFPDKRDIAPFEPIPSLGGETVVRVREASSLHEHNVRAQHWARTVWSAWASHHQRVRDLLEACPVWRP
jgi:hypothetical protein